MGIINYSFTSLTSSLEMQGVGYDSDDRITVVLKSLLGIKDWIFDNMRAYSRAILAISRIYDHDKILLNDITGFDPWLSQFFAGGYVSFYETYKEWVVGEESATAQFFYSDFVRYELGVRPTYLRNYLDFAVDEITRSDGYISISGVSNHAALTLRVEINELLDSIVDEHINIFFIRQFGLNITNLGYTLKLLDQSIYDERFALLETIHSPEMMDFIDYTIISELAYRTKNYAEAVHHGSLAIMRRMRFTDNAKNTLRYLSSDEAGDKAHDLIKNAHYFKPDYFVALSYMKLYRYRTAEIALNDVIEEAKKINLGVSSILISKAVVHILLQEYELSEKILRDELENSHGSNDRYVIMLNLSLSLAYRKEFVNALLIIEKLGDKIPEYRYDTLRLIYGIRFSAAISDFDAIRVFLDMFIEGGDKFVTEAYVDLLIIANTIEYPTDKLYLLAMHSVTRFKKELDQYIIELIHAISRYFLLDYSSAIQILQSIPEDVFRPAYQSIYYMLIIEAYLQIQDMAKVYTYRSRFLEYLDKFKPTAIISKLGAELSPGVFFDDLNLLGIFLVGNIIKEVF